MSHQVIIADDDMGLLNILSRRIRHLGFQVEEASDGLMASLGLFVGTDARDAPELIILDVNMPIDDGLSICDVLRREQALASVPVIMMTGRSDASTIQRCRELGAHYVHKSGDVWKKLEPLIHELTKHNARSEQAQAGIVGSGAAGMTAPAREDESQMPMDMPEGPPAGPAQRDMMSMMMSYPRPPEGSEPPMNPMAMNPMAMNSMDMNPMPMDSMPMDSMAMNVAPVSDASIDTKSNPPQGMPPDAQLPKVLLVDDDDELTAAIEKRLTEAGFDVKRAGNCIDGYWTALKEQPDAIVADYVMPDSYGSYLVRRLREHPLTKNIPVIVLTGCDLGGRTTNRSDYSLERQFLNMGAETVLRKPIDHQSLVHEIRRHVHFPVESMRVERMREMEHCT